MFVLIFGLQGYFGPFLRRDGYSIMPYVVSHAGRSRVSSLLYFLLRPDQSGEHARGMLERIRGWP